MLEETISRVQAAESRAQQILEEAEEEQRRILEKARKEGETEKERRILEAESQTAEELQKIKLREEEKLDTAREEAGKGGARIREQALEQEERAVEMIRKFLLE